MVQRIYFLALSSSLLISLLLGTTTIFMGSSESKPYKPEPPRDPNFMPRRATFAAGCYWGTENYFRKTFGANLSNAAVGFMGGPGETNPGYEKVCSGTTGHAEVYSFEYDESKVQYVELLQLFFRMHNPTTKNYQGNDRGTQYRSAVFYHDEEQQALAEEYISKINQGTDANLLALHQKAFGDNKIATTIEKAGTFFPAHEDHQQYLERNPNGYCNHRIYYKL